MTASKYACRRLVVMFVCLIQIFLSLGLIFGFSVMYADLTIVFDLSRLKSATIQGVYNLVSLGGGIIWTWPVKKIGYGLSLAVGSTIGCIGFIASSLAKDYETIIVCTGIITGAGISLGFLAPFAIVGVLFEEAGFPLALVTLAGSIGQMLLPYIYEIFLTFYHWSGAFILLAGVALQGIPCGLVIHFSNHLLETDNDHDTKQSSTDGIWLSLLTDYSTWLYLFMTLIMFATVNFAPWFLVDQMVSIGYSQHFGAFLLTILGLANVFARIIGSILKLKFKSLPGIYNMFYICPLIAIAHALVILFQRHGNQLILGCIVYGLGYGLLVVMLPVVTFELFGSEQFQQAFTLICLALGLATIIGNFTGGIIRDVYGNYDVAYKLGIVVSLLVMVGFIVLAFIKHRRQKKKDNLLHQGNVKDIQYRSIK